MQCIVIKETDKISAMRKYKTTGNTTLFDKEDTERKLTEMDALQPHCSCGSSTTTAFSTAKTAANVLPTTP